MTRADSNAPVDNDLFGINLGPRLAANEPDDSGEEVSAPTRPPARTLTQRLAAAAAVRTHTSRAIDEKRPPKK